MLYSIIIIAVIYNVFVSYHIILEDRKEKEIYDAKIDFFINLAHEIKTPLTLIKSPIENLLERVDDVPQMKEHIVLFENDGFKIPHDKREKIFEPFYRLSESKQEVTGLALARSLTKLINGNLYLKETTDSSIRNGNLIK